MSKHAALLGIQYLVPVEMVELGASAAKHQSHGGGLQPCEKQDGLRGRGGRGGFPWGSLGNATFWVGATPIMAIQPQGANGVLSPRSCTPDFQKETGIQARTRRGTPPEPALSTQLCAHGPAHTFHTSHPSSPTQPSFIDISGPDLNTSSVFRLGRPR